MKSAHIVFAFIICGCGLVASVQACTPTSNIKEISTDSFLSGIPCSAPCFLDSTPGITNKNEVFDHLRKYGLLSSCVEKQIEKEILSVLICDPSIDFWFTKDELTKIMIEPTNAITIEQVIKKYGDPTSVNYTLGGINSLILVKLVYYENYQFVLHLSDPTISEPHDYSITPQSNVLWIDYVDEERLKTYIDKCTFPWKGYDEYELIPGC